MHAIVVSMAAPSPSDRDSDVARAPAAAPTERQGGARERLARLGARQWSWMAPAVIGAHLAVAMLAVPAAAADPSAEPRPPGEERRGAPIFVVAIANPAPKPTPARVAPPLAAPAPSRAPRPAPAASIVSPALAPAVSIAAVALVPPASRLSPGAGAPPASLPEPIAPPVQGGDGAGAPVVLAAAGGAGSVPEAGPQPGPPRAPELPAYPTRIPAPVLLPYDLRRGLFTGTGVLSWQPAGDRYTARLEGRVAGLLILEWSSEGGFDAAGLAPTRYVDRRRNGNRQAANFQRDVGRVSYSGPSVEYALPVGAQDRLSWMLQIAAIAEARPQAVARDASVSMWVSGARGDADVWVFRSQGVQALELPGGTLPTVKLVRVPRQPYDTRVEVWLDPSRGHLPVRARLINGRDDDDALELTLRR
jgi:hypothetical protein